MTEYQASQVERFDNDITDYFIEQTMAQNPGITRNTAEAQVRTRARLLLQQGENVTIAMLAGLDSLIRSANKLSGRKLVFLISGGFFIGPQEGSTNRIQRISSLAARSGAVIYSIDARGLVSTMADASADVPFDITGRLQRGSIGELTASQNGLNALANDTGGKTVFNTNALGTGLTKALKETSTYYLLAWKPEGETQHASKFHRIEVKVIGRPQLAVQVRRGFYDVEPDRGKAQQAQRVSAEKNGRAGFASETGRRISRARNSSFLKPRLPQCLGKRLAADNNDGGTKQLSYF
jgi:VWFA-related protein